MPDLTPAVRLRERRHWRLNGPRGVALLSGAAIAAVHTGAYIDVDPDRGVTLPSGLDALDAAVPLGVYAALWGAAAACALIGAVRTRDGHQRDGWDAWGFGLLAGMLVVWGCTYLIAWGTDGFRSQAWVFGVIYLSVAVLVAAAARMTNPGSARTQP